MLILAELVLETTIVLTSYDIQDCDIFATHVVGKIVWSQHKPIKADSISLDPFIV